MKFLLNKFEGIGAPTKVYKLINDIETWTDISFYVRIETIIEGCPYNEIVIDEKPTKKHLFVQIDFITIELIKTLSAEQLDSQLLVKVNEFITNTYPDIP